MTRQFLALTGSDALLKPFYQLNYLAAAKECGLFELLLDAPKRFEQLAEVYCKDDKAREALDASGHTRRETSSGETDQIASEPVSAR